MIHKCLQVFILKNSDEDKKSILQNKELFGIAFVGAPVGVT